MCHVGSKPQALMTKIGILFQHYVAKYNQDTDTFILNKHFDLTVKLSKDITIT